MDKAHDSLKRRFAEVFGDGGRVHIVRAPGRVNLIGEHTDYNDGFVFPMAIEPNVMIACRGRDDAKVRVASTAFPGEVVEFSLSEKIKPGDPDWANYSKGIAAELLGAGIPLVGMDALMDNTLPLGGGLSSSAAVEVGTGVALLSLAGLEMDPGRLALLAQKAEHEYAGVPVGIMDQTIVAAGKEGHAMLLDCRDKSQRFVPIDSRELRVVVANSMVKHKLTGGEYAQRRRQCEEGVTFFQKENPEVRALRDVTVHQVEAAKGKMDDVVWRRCHHVVTENLRTTDAANKLTQKAYEEVGELMVKSHNSLRNDYEVSVPELDFLVEEAMRVKGVYGARMTGGGFGGCIVALAQPRAVEPLERALGEKYQEKFGKKPEIFATTATAGARLVE
ncbi:MAG TPA: galactokinase [Tepidisphaeraceae bacterium]|jgi:galactokinase